MSHSSLAALPTRDYSILSPSQLYLLKQRARPIQRDTSLDEEIQRRQQRHQATSSLVSAWPNTITRNRIDRQTRLQREKDAEEQRKQAIDEEEKRIKKLKREAQLSEARKAEFAQRAEVRAVNAQLLLHEVQMEREVQQSYKEKQRLIEMKKQIQEDERLEREHQQLVEKEEAIKKERRLKALEIAKGFKKQLEEKEDRIAAQKAADFEEEVIILQHNQKEAAMERQAVARQKELARKQMEESVRENDLMIRYKDQMKKIDELEDARIRQLQIELMDEEDRRKEFDEKRRRDKLLARESLIEAERQRQLATKTQQDDFLDKQLREQHEKDMKELEQIRTKQTRLLDERRRDYLQSMAIKNEMEKEKTNRKYNKQPFPFDGNTLLEDQARERDMKKMQNLKDLQKFQLQQMREKKEREAAEKERERLEFLHERQKDEEELQMAHDYAKRLLEKAEAEDNEVY